MGVESGEFDGALHQGFVYVVPEGKPEVDLSQAPGPGDDIRAESGWHIQQLAYHLVVKEDGSSWAKEEVLDAIANGHADAFVDMGFRFPPNDFGTWHPQLHPLTFDDRDLGARVADQTLLGFNREPRSQQPLDY